MSMEPLRLLGGKKITLTEALEEEDNILQELTYPKLRLEFCVYLLKHRHALIDLVAFHLKIDPKTCTLSEVEDWRHGSFNWAIPIHLNWNGRSRVLLRIPLPYKLGETRYPGNIDEKLRCEAATYAYIQERSPDVPIPMLWGFGFSDGSHFTALQNMPFLCRFHRYIRNYIRRIFQYPIPASYVRRSDLKSITIGYLLMDYVEEGEMLSNTFTKHVDDQRHRRNLFRDLSRIMLSLTKTPLPRIGSFTMDNCGFISLTNRPLTLRLQYLENEGIPTNIRRRRTYSSVEPYFLDLLSYHDSRLIHQPNSINDETDGRKQMAAITIMRSVFLDCVASRNGPFVFTLTDMHQGNIFVDRDWHVTSLIDLEWACSLPVEMQNPPYWITGQRVDRLTGDELHKFSCAWEEFMRIFEEEEQNYPWTLGDTRTSFIRRSWNLGGFWIFHALDSTKGFYNLFLQHVLPRYSLVFPYLEVSAFWRGNVKGILQAKLDDKRAYLEEVKQAAACQNPDSDNEEWAED